MNDHHSTAELEEAPPTPAIGDVIARKYRVDSVVGTGGMGVVLSATHLELGQKVAIKVLTIPEDDARLDEARERFLREGRATATLVSDHVVRVYDVGTLENGAPFMVMELLRGRDLSVLLQQVGPLPIEHAAEFVRQAADAIATAHAHGIVHRDLKPSNLFLTQRSDGAPLIKVLDFGISKTTQSGLAPVTNNLTAAQSVLGTPFYMSPEQIRDAKQVDFRTDIWSLGLILHELLSGAPAFEGTTLPGVCAAIAADPPAALRLKRPDVPVELEAIVLKCLEKSASKRFQDTRELLAVLAPYCRRADNGSLLPLSDSARSLSPGLPAIGEGPTVSLAALNDSGTMASAVLARSGERVVPSKAPSQAKVEQTLSELPITSPTPAPVGSRPSATGRSLWLVGAGVLGLLLVGVWALRSPSSADLGAGRPSVASANLGPANAPSSEPRSTSFSLEIAASEPDARVYEGNELLGSTPLRLTIDPNSVAGSPRTFTVRKAGFAPYTIVQGAAHEDAHVLAELSPEPAIAPGAAAGAAKPTSVRKPKKPAPLAAPAPAAKPGAANPPADIFMQR